MKKNNFFVGTLVLVLVLGFWAIGCDTTTGGETDTWSNITSLSQVNGTWKGSYSETVTEEGITTKTDVEMIMVIDADAETSEMTLTMTMTFSGNGIAEAWETIKEMFENADEESGEYSFDDDNYSISMTVVTESNSITLEGMAGGQINQSGTKIKSPASGNDPEMIYIKQ
jgi:hypothetical protein